MLKTIRDSLLGLFTALAGALLSIFAITKALARKDHPDPYPDTASNRADAPRAESAVSKLTLGDPITDPQIAQHARPAPRPPGWTKARPEKLSPPTYWPVIMSVGITLIFWGLAGAPILSGVGLIVFAVSVAGWIADLRKEAHED